MLGFYIPARGEVLQTVGLMDFVNKLPMGINTNIGVAGVTMSGGESKSGKTLVIAAHRLSTVRNADKIVYIKDGRIEEVGSHEELCDLKGEYWKLVRNQLQLTV